MYDKKGEADYDVAENSLRREGYIEYFPSIAPSMAG